MTLQQWLASAVSQLSFNHPDNTSPKCDAEVILQFVTGKSRAYIMAFGETLLTHEQLQQLNVLLQRRCKGEPVAYLTGEREFWSLPLLVSPVTLIPRADTECLVELTLKYMPSHSCQLADLGTGTGAIALAIASERPDCHIFGVDIHPQAVTLAKQNAKRLKIDNVTFMESNWFSALNGRLFTLIVSNPPYIDMNDPHLLQGDVRFEPTSALVADEQGLADIRHIIFTSYQHILTGGWLLIEHGWQQAECVQALFRQAGYINIKTYQDYAGNNRVTLGQYYHS